MNFSRQLFSGYVMIGKTFIFLLGHTFLPFTRVLLFFCLFQFQIYDNKEVTITLGFNREMVAVEVALSAAETDLQQVAFSNGKIK